MDGNKAKIISFLEKYNEETFFKIEEIKTKNLLSRAQQKYYWGCVIDIISNHHGMTPIETHLAIKQTFGIKTTTDLSTSEFKYIMEMIQELWMTKFGVIIPKPNELKDLKDLEKYLF